VVECCEAGEWLESQASRSIHCIVTSPPYYGQRDYGGGDGEVGQELSFDAYVESVVSLVNKMFDPLRDDGSIFLNIGDTCEDGCMLGVPWRVALALVDDGWFLKQDVVWQKPSPMPSGDTTRCTRAHEFVFVLSKIKKPYYDYVAIAEPGSLEGQLVNRRSVWRIATKGYKGAHFATMPEELAALCIKAGTSEGGCCEECGAPRRRLISKTKLTRKRPNDKVKRKGEAGTGNSCGNTVAGVAVETIGWEKTCSCDADHVPCVVADPFAGSGTTLAVAKTLGRIGIGCELNPDYIKLAESRIAEAVAPPSRYLEGQKKLW